MTNHVLTNIVNFMHFQLIICKSSISPPVAGNECSLNWIEAFRKLCRFLQTKRQELN